ncbi:NAD(P)-dependent oxidoreductase, partial [filamentous cyanobacterium CCP5]
MQKVSQLEPLANRVALVKGTESSHLAALLQDQDLLLVCVGAGRGGSYERTYLHTAQTLAAVLAQTPVEQVIFTSSYSLYGDHQGAWVTEAMPPKPAGDKAEIMLATERTLLDTASHRCRVCVFRLGGIYGPGRELGRIFSRSAGSTRPG